MEENNMRFGTYIHQKRFDDPRILTMRDVAQHLGISITYVSEVENLRRGPFNGERLTKLALFLNLSDEETALMFDLASRENHRVPYDIEDTLLYGEVGKLARYALRQSKSGFINEEDWRAFLRQIEEKKKEQAKATTQFQRD